MVKCDKCNQELPEPVYVGPGDEVLHDGHGPFVVIGTKDMWIVCESDGHDETGDAYDGYPARSLTTLDGRPVAGFRDPAQEDLRIARERIKELEDIRDGYTAHHDHLYAKVALLERQLKAMEISDEDVRLFTLGYGEHTMGIMKGEMLVIRARINERKDSVT